MTLYVHHRPGFSRDVSGAGLGEYALLAALIAGVSVIAVTSLGVETRGTFSQIADATQETGGGAGGGGSGSGGTSGGSVGGGSGDNGSGGSGGSGDGGGASPAPGTPGENFAITLGSQALPPANRLTPWSFDFSSLIAFQDPGTVDLSNLSWSGGSPSLPSWMSLDPNTGVASGTPDVAGQATFEVVASYLDAAGRRVFVIEVESTLLDVVQIAAGSLHTCVITTSGAVMCWGSNAQGRLGDGTMIDRQHPVYVSGLNDSVTSISAGLWHTCAVTAAGAAVCWGSNSNGQLGDGTTTDQSTPVVVSGLHSGITSISAGGRHTCAITAAGAARCWGQNSTGQLGNGSTNSSSVPVMVASPGNSVSSISAGFQHTCAVTSSGAAICWGSGANGRLGTGWAVDQTTPVTVSGLASDVAHVSAAGNNSSTGHSCAVRMSGAVMCWGFNGDGQVGDGTTITRSTPVTVSDLGSGAVSVSAGYHHTCAVLSNGSVRCWGRNAQGQLGDGTTIQRLTPVNVLSVDSGITTISTGGWHTCAVGSAGVKCWGQNNFGQLGDGTLQNRSVAGDVIR